MERRILPMKEQYEEYVVDESKFSGFADSISFPESEKEILEVLRELRRMQIPVTIQGGKTGIVGGAVPQGGHIMNLTHMNQVKESVIMEDKTGRITVEPGLNLMDLKKEIDRLFRKTPLFWPPDPTETSATVGGIAAAGAQGISRFLYGRSETYIESLRLVGYDGQVRKVEREDKLFLPSGKECAFLDAVLGKEGITGAISELTLVLLPKPESQWGITFFFAKTAEAGAFIHELKSNMPTSEDAAVAAAEFMDRDTIHLIEQRKGTMAKIKDLPDVGEHIAALVYIELHGREQAVEELAEVLMETAISCGSDPDEAWAVSGEAEVERLHAFRHAAAEAANLTIEEVRRTDERITKLGTDMAADELSFGCIYEQCRMDIEQAGLRGCVFGHALENHLHVNLLPNSYEEYKEGLLLLQKWAEKIAEHQGSVIGEHGVGKLKRLVLGEYIPQAYQEYCRQLKTVLDCNGKWNQGNIFGEEADSI